MKASRSVSALTTFGPPQISASPGFLCCLSDRSIGSKGEATKAARNLLPCMNGLECEPEVAEAREFFECEYVRISRRPTEGRGERSADFLGSSWRSLS